MEQQTLYEKLVKKSKRQHLEDGLYGEFQLFNLPLPHRQYYFHPERKWRVDFAWPDKKIIVEVQGGLFLHTGTGGHNRGAYMEKEYEKSNAAAALGWRVFKFGPKACYRPKSGSSQALAFMYPILEGTQ